MADNDLSTNATSWFGRRQPQADRRTETVGCSVSTAERKQILAALQQSGFVNQSHGVRVVLLVFASSAVVRDAVAEALSAAA